MMFQEDRKWMAQAMELAKIAALNGEVPVGTVIVLDGKQIASGQNRIEELHSAAAHAEILAINEAGNNIKNWRLDGATLYVTLEPCPMCWGAIRNSRISKVVFAAKDTRNSEATPYECIVENGLLENESVEILQTFFRNVRRIKGDSGTKLLPCAT